ncbi:MAG: dTDP-4-dehydrorhamnose reductase, partial [Gammaproteobacteria bacterium]|nr:dTDP-4-dehydrorhamnose reductase [Gammaproteobacteria bacterium]
MTPLELWGGVECTVNRVHDTWSDQLVLSGHAQHVTDLDLLANLGIRTLRYPILWERTAPDSLARPRWGWADERLCRLRDLGMRPIVGLAHHGSGPRYTSLLDDSFATGLAEFAALVAARYPWITHYTPVNEPLTTARFSALYGHWYPHHRSNASFAKAFINQCRAIVLAMQAIRRVNPAAQLVQTEDLGTTYSTEHMRYQADFDNERRWLTVDLLCGGVGHGHPLYPFLCASGIAASDLEWFASHPCPPQTIGINHYVTSDRYLDERCAQYAPNHCGNNSRERYADIAAVRALPEAQGGWQVISQAWERYRRPIALTEVHLGCTREEQLRWLNEAWLAATSARDSGIDVAAVTAWSLFGAFNWDALLTRTTGCYEPGAFDVRGGRRRPTALSRLIRALTSKSQLRHPTLQPHGWWRGSPKMLSPEKRVSRINNGGRRERPAPPVLICGASGSLGRALANACNVRNIPARLLDHSQLDIVDRRAVGDALDQLRPWALVNAAGYVRVDDAEREAYQCFEANSAGTGVLAAAAGDADIPFLTFSSDLVFDGNTRTPYVESSPLMPINTYGRSKAAAELSALQYPRTLCVRTAAFFGAWGRGDFLTDTLLHLAHGQSVRAMDNVIVSPTFLPDLAESCLDLLIDELTGVVHLTNEGQVSWADFAERGAVALGISTRTLERRPVENLSLAAPRPVFTALRSERVSLMPTLDTALRRYADGARHSLRQALHASLPSTPNVDGIKPKSNGKAIPSA